MQSLQYWAEKCINEREESAYLKS